MNNITNVISYIIIFVEITVIMITYYYLKKQYNYAVYCYSKNQNRKKMVYIKRNDNIVENIIISNITQEIDVDELNDKISPPVLSFRLDGREIIEIPINNEKIFIGRGKSDDIVINEPTISRSHCVITKENDKFFINIDINKNPVKLNRKKIVKEREKPFKEEISDGDIISMGNGRITFQFTIPQNYVIA